MRRLADYLYWIVPLAAWSLLVALSLGLVLRHTEDSARDVARQQGRDIFHMVEAMRAWNARHGGVFMRQSESLPPNPYLKLPERDPVTTSGIPLTTVNPAYMTRQMASVIAQESGIRIHITSNRPINPDNRPEGWEAEALTRFENGSAREHSEILRDDAPVIRYMAPLFVRQECLQCHEAQHYRVGDVRGGISVVIPAADFVARLARERRDHWVTHLGVWALVGLLLAIYLRRYRRQWHALRALTDNLEQRVAERTAALESEITAHRASEAEARRSERRFMDLVNTTDGIVWEADAQTFAFTFVSQRAETLLGYPVDDWKTPGFWVDHLHPEDRGWAPQFCASCTGRLEAHRFEYRFIAANGQTVWLEDIVTVTEENGRPALLRGLMVDITARKEAESEVRSLTQRLTLATRAAQIGIWDFEPETGKVVWDNTMYQIFGLDRSQFHGRFDEIAVLIHPDDRPMLEALTQETLKTGRDFVTSFRILKHGTELRHIDAHAVLVPATAVRPARLIGVNRDITESKRNEQELLRLATTDPLTGCHNRHYLHRVLEHEVDRARRYATPLSLIMYDLDHFKQINDRFGHDVGDRVLVHNAEIVRDAIRRTDVLARWGGEEFLVLCPSTSADEASVLAERAMHALRNHPAPVAGTVTASFGVVTLREGEGTDALLRRADDLMYRAKHAGRDQARSDTEPA